MSSPYIRHGTEPPADSEPPEIAALVDRLAREMDDAWKRGERPRTEEFLDRHPILYDFPVAVCRLIYEEFSIRHEGEDIAEEELATEMLARFPQWTEGVELTLSSDRVVRDALGPEADFPEVGETVGDFRLLRELGRGSLGRVYLATQTSLAHRPLVLKLTPCHGQEHLSLARLQHTHIVPLFSAQDLTDRNLRILCMPFLGVTTWQALLQELEHPPARERNGRTIVEALARARRQAPDVLPPAGREAELLQGLSWVQAVCRIGAFLADALGYAHERGLVHLDIKPSNILLGSDGQPLILDFNMARLAIQRGSEAPDWLGGTPQYMSPEQRAALENMTQGRPVPEAVDERSDIYSLGLVLYEALGGQRAILGDADLAQLRRSNPEVSTGLSDILCKCLAKNAADRYQRAADLAEDLRRHREDLPLRGVANRSWRERWRKWRRRRPLALPLLGMGAALVVALLAGGVSVLSHFEELHRTAEVALRAGQEQIRNGHYAEAIETLRQGQAKAAGLWGNEELAEGLAGHLVLAKRGLKAKELHDLAGYLRFYTLQEGASRKALHVFEAACHQVWLERAFVAQRVGAGLGTSLEKAIHTDLLDMAILWGRVRVLKATTDKVTDARRQAVQVLTEAEALLGPNPILIGEKLFHARALGDLGLVQRWEKEPQMPRTAWDHYARGMLQLRAGDLEEAARLSQRALELQPMSYLPNLSLAVCAYRKGRHQEAVTLLSDSIGQERRAEGYFLRALAFNALGQTSQAAKDLNFAVQLDATVAPAYLERAKLLLAQKRFNEAEQDLRRAQEKGADPENVLYQWALVHVGQGDIPDARKKLHEALRHEPAHADSLILQKRLADLP